MTLPVWSNTTPLSLGNIQAEFGGTGNISLSEYYAGGLYVTAGTTGSYQGVTTPIPSSGNISIGNFYGASAGGGGGGTTTTSTTTTTTTAAVATTSIVISTDQNALNLRTYALSQGWNGTNFLVVTIQSNIVISGTSPALTIDGVYPNALHIINNGFIIGRGGAGGEGDSTSVITNTAGQDGDTALKVTSSGQNIYITNNNIIAGGGGGGGGSGAYTSEGQQDGAPGGGGQSGRVQSLGTPPGTFAAPGGNGGIWGQPGSSGNDGAYYGNLRPGGPGGLAGYWVDGADKIILIGAEGSNERGRKLPNIAVTTLPSVPSNPNQPPTTTTTTAAVPLELVFQTTGTSRFTPASYLKTNLSNGALDLALSGGGSGPYWVADQSLSYNGVYRTSIIRPADSGSYVYDGPVDYTSPPFPFQNGFQNYFQENQSTAITAAPYPGGAKWVKAIEQFGTSDPETSTVTNGYVLLNWGHAAGGDQAYAVDQRFTTTNNVNCRIVGTPYVFLGIHYGNSTTQIAIGTKLGEVGLNTDLAIKIRLYDPVNNTLLATHNTWVPAPNAPGFGFASSSGVLTADTPNVCWQDITSYYNNPTTWIRTNYVDVGDPGNNTSSGDWGVFKSRVQSGLPTKMTITLGH